MEDDNGHFKAVETPNTEDIRSWISEIEKNPSLLRNSVIDLDDKQLNTPYRLGGWTIRQIVHHIADNNMHTYSRFKRTLTEDCPFIPTYNQDKWAELIDYQEPIENSLKLMDCIYTRFLVLLRSLDHEDYKRTMNSQTYGMISLEVAIQRFMWHDRHHLSQIQNLRSKLGWFL
jgi:uncharacterized damage-inducible protein DinB